MRYRLQFWIYHDFQDCHYCNYWYHVLRVINATYHFINFRYGLVVYFVYYFLLPGWLLVQGQSNWIIPALESTFARYQQMAPQWTYWTKSKIKRRSLIVAKKLYILHFRWVNNLIRPCSLSIFVKNNSTFLATSNNINILPFLET